MIELHYGDDDDIRKAAVFIAELKRQGIEFTITATVDRDVLMVELHGH